MQAWEFEESEFFQVRGEGGTRVSGAFWQALEILRQRYDPSVYNSYLFYASDGENFPDDRQAATEALDQLVKLVNLMGYVEVSRYSRGGLNTEMGQICKSLTAGGAPVGSYSIHTQDDIWPAIRNFFTEQAA